MNKAIERPPQREEMIGRFQMAIDEDGEPVDWDSAVARFLLAVTARGFFDIGRRSCRATVSGNPSTGAERIFWAKLDF